MKTWLCWTVLAAVLVPAACLAGGPSAAAPSPLAAVDEAKIKELADSILSEAERQHMVNHRMGSAVTGLDALFKDLESNDLIPQGRGPEIKRFVTVLTVLNVRHVPNAARYLEEARKRLAALYPNLSAADAEIQIILELLAKLLDPAKGTGEVDDLLTQLRIIIRNQEKMLADTTVWGRKLIKAPQDAEAARQAEELKPRQAQVAASVRVFEGNLNDAHKQSAADPLREDRLGKASAAMKQMKIDKALDSAAGEIEQKKPVRATQRQEAALADLREIERLLMTDPLWTQIDKMQQAKQELQKILEKQQELTAKTEDTPKEEFSQKAKEQQLEQRDIKNELQKAAENVPQAAKPQVQKPLENAEKAMDKAEKAMEQSQQPQAVENEKKAEEALKEAISKLDQQIAQAEAQRNQQQQQQEAKSRLQQAQQQVQSLLKRQQQLAQTTKQTQAQELQNLSKPQSDLGEETKEAAKDTQEAGKPLEEASKEMGQASESMEKGEKSDAEQHQEAAIAALQQAAEAVQQAMDAQQAEPTQITTPTKTDNPQEKGDRDFGKEKPEGQAARDKTHWDYLKPKDREALKQNFARDLPQEYRELLEDYYKALSK